MKGPKQYSVDLYGVMSGVFFIDGGDPTNPRTLFDHVK